MLWTDGGGGGLRDGEERGREEKIHERDRLGALHLLVEMQAIRVCAAGPFDLPLGTAGVDRAAAFAVDRVGVAFVGQAHRGIGADAFVHLAIPGGAVFRLGAGPMHF